MGNPIQSDQEEKTAYFKTVVLVGTVTLFGIISTYLFFHITDSQESLPSMGSGVVTQLDGKDSADNAFYEAKSFDTSGEYEKAEPYYREALEIKRGNPKTGSIKYATILAWAGQNASKRNKSDEAIDFFTQAIDLQLKDLGPKHEHIAMNLISLASAYHDVQKYELALLKVEQAKSMDSVLSKHMKGTVEYWFGDILWHQKKYQEAAPHLSACVELRRQSASKHELAIALKKYATVLRCLKKDREADSLDRERDKIKH